MRVDEQKYTHVRKCRVEEHSCEELQKRLRKSKVEFPQRLLEPLYDFWVHEVSARSPGQRGRGGLAKAMTSEGENGFL